MLTQPGPAGRIVFLLDVDNTLLDNDRFGADLGRRLAELFGPVQRDRYWTIFQRLHATLGMADYLATLQEFRAGLHDHPDLLQVGGFILDYPFAKLVYPRALDTVAHLQCLGTPVVLSDGDLVLQPRKVRHSGIWAAVQGRVLIYVHKERVLADVQTRYPAAHYIVVDDKPNLLTAMKRKLGSRLTTIFVRQGQYAHAAAARSEPAPDLTIERIDDLLTHTLSDFQVRHENHATTP